MEIRNSLGVDMRNELASIQRWIEMNEKILMVDLSTKSGYYRL